MEKFIEELQKVDLMESTIEKVWRLETISFLIKQESEKLRRSMT